MTDNPSAFPSVCLNDPGHPQSVPGMSLRDWYAGKALVGLLTSPYNNDVVARRFAQASYEMADAMLAERARTSS
jgi:hypothetical protein